ncbi:MAG: hypothetical protein Q9187_005913, partial [Circinaria calcarea]
DLVTFGPGEKGEHKREGKGEHQHHTHRHRCHITSPTEFVKHIDRKQKQEEN